MAARAPGWSDAPQRMQVDGDALLRLTLRSLHAGHWRVACRRFLMLRASGQVVPADLQATCEALLARCSERERRAMDGDAERWSKWRVQRGVPAAPRDSPAQQEIAGPPQGARTEAPGDVRTQWRPFPAFLLMPMK